MINSFSFKHNLKHSAWDYHKLYNNCPCYMRSMLFVKFSLVAVYLIVKIPNMITISVFKRCFR